MTAGKHTPGPWMVHKSFPHYVIPMAHEGRRVGFAVDVDRDREEFVQIICQNERTSRHRSEDELKANARLIAAAPDLLDELMQANAQMKMAVECIENKRYDEALLHVSAMSHKRLAAIAKATGEA